MAPTLRLMRSFREVQQKCAISSEGYAASRTNSCNHLPSTVYGPEELTYTWTPQACKIFAISTIFTECGPLLYILLGPGIMVLHIPGIDVIKYQITTSQDLKQIYVILF